MKSSRILLLLLPLTIAACSHKPVPRTLEGAGIGAAGGAMVGGLAGGGEGAAIGAGSGAAVGAGVGYMTSDRHRNRVDDGGRYDPTVNRGYLNYPGPGYPKGYPQY